MLAGKAAGHCRRGGQKADLELAMMCSSKGRALDGGEHAAGPAGPEPGGPGDASCFPCPRALPCQLDATRGAARSEEHTSELQSLMRISYAVFCLKKTNTT